MLTPTRRFSIKYSYSEDKGLKINSFIDIDELNNYQLKSLFNLLVEKASDLIINCMYENRNPTIQEKSIITSCIFWANVILPRTYNEKSLYLLYSKKINCFKIGVTKNIEQRISSISRDMRLNDIRIIHLIPGHSSMEKGLHNKFSNLNKRFIGIDGTEHREWFDYSDEIINFFNDLNEKIL